MHTPVALGVIMIFNTINCCVLFFGHFMGAILGIAISKFLEDRNTGSYFILYYQ